MCGIAGELRLEPRGRASAERVRAMNDVMVHRGPDSFGAFTDGEVALGMRRLAIVDVAHGQQPLGNEDGSVQVICNGEIYNSPALRRELQGKGHVVRTGSDVEVIAHLYEEYGLDMVERLDGMFALALWDSGRRRLVLARDRAGIKPLYLTEQGGSLLFGSELKCLLAAGIEAEVDPQVLSDYLTLGYVPQPASMVAGVRQLAPGHLLIAEPWSAGTKVQERPYWSLRGHGHQGTARSEAEWEEALVATLREAVRSHLMADVPLGVFLSGGVDSGTIVALMSELGVAPIRTFTIGFEEKSFSEVDLARQVAERYGTQHHERVVRPGDAGLLSKLVHHFDEPFADSSAIPVYYLSELARQHVTVVLSGEGGDEAFAGYETYRARKYAALYARIPRLIGAGLMPAIVRRLPVSHDRVSFDYKAKRFVDGAYLPPAAGHLWWKTVLTDDAKRAVYALDAAQVEPTVRLFERAYAEGDGNEIDRLQYIDNQVYLPSDILVKCDRMTMAHSLEARVPFCDRSVVEFARSMPSSLRLKGFTGKYLLRRAMRSRLPAAIANGKKKGFNVPIPSWIGSGLRELIGDALAPAHLRRQGLLHPDGVAQLVQEHTALQADHSRAIWTLLMLSVWYQEVLRGTRYPTPSAGMAASHSA
jgi:asparagine synthase (glutamine-hydrolysing)